MAHKPNHPKTRVTSSRTRSKGTAKTPVSGAKPSSRANRSKVSTAKVTSEAKTRPSGERGIFEKPNPKVTKGAGTKYQGLQNFLRQYGAPIFFVDDSPAELDAVRGAGLTEAEIQTFLIRRPRGHHKNEKPEFPHKEISSLTEIFD